MKKTLRLGDFLITAILLFAALFLLFSPFRTTGEIVVVSVDGVVIDQFPLQGDDQDFSYEEADFSFTLRREDGRVAMVNMDCPDQSCVKTGYISLSGSSIICLPNRVTVLVTGETEVDFVLG